MKLAFIIDNLGPYHVARLCAIAKLAEVLAIEVRQASSEYAWARTGSVPFRRLTLLVGNSVVDPRPLLCSTLDAAAPDVVFTSGWGSAADLAALQWAGRQRVPVIVMSDSNADDAPRRAPVEWVKQRLLAHVAGAFVAGTRSFEYATQLGIPSHMIRIGYDVVDNAHFAARPDGARKGFIVSARFIQVKNLPFIMRAYAAYRDLHRIASADERPWTLNLVGDGALRNELEELALGFRSDVVFRGFLQYEDLPSAYAGAGTLLLPSVKDTWGLVVNEGMAAGLPVLVSQRCGCVPDLLEEGVNGYALDPADQAAWAKRMLFLALMPSESRVAMGAASQRIVARFSPETHAEAAVDLAGNALSRPLPRLRDLDALLLSAAAAWRSM